MAARRETLSMRDRYQLRLLVTQNRFYGAVANLRRLEQRGFIVSTQRTDDDGRAEWTITQAGRAALAEIEP